GGQARADHHARVQQLPTQSRDRSGALHVHGAARRRRDRRAARGRRRGDTWREPLSLVPVPLRHPAAWLTIGWSLVACAIIGSLMPGNAVSKLGLFKIGDKLLHAGMYAALAIWFTGIYPRSRYVAIAVGLFLLGVLAELGQ